MAPTSLMHKRFMFGLFVMVLVMGIFIYATFFNPDCSACVSVGGFATLPHMLFASFIDLPITMGLVVDAAAWFVVGFLISLMFFRQKTAATLSAK